MARLLLTSLSYLAYREQGIKKCQRIALVEAYGTVFAAVTGAHLAYVNEYLQRHAGPTENTRQVEMLEELQRTIEKGKETASMLAAIQGAKNVDADFLFGHLRCSPEALRCMADVGIFSSTPEKLVREQQTGAEPSSSHVPGTDPASVNDPSSEIEQLHTQIQQVVDLLSYLVQMHESVGGGRFDDLSHISRGLAKLSQAPRGHPETPQDHTQKPDGTDSAGGPGGAPREANASDYQRTSTVHQADSGSRSRGSRTKGHGNGDGQSAARPSSVKMANPVTIRTGSPHEFIRKAPQNTYPEAGSAESTYPSAPSAPIGRQPYDTLMKSPTRANIAEQEPGT